jgi:hypothetical protein
MGQLSAQVPGMLQALCVRALQVSWRPMSPQSTCSTALGPARGLNSRPAQPVTRNSLYRGCSRVQSQFLCLDRKIRRSKVRLCP